MLKKLARRLLYRPRGIEIGVDSYVMLPRWFSNHDRIHIGARSVVRRFSVFNPLVEYAGQPQAGRIHVGDDVYIGGYCQLHSMLKLEIGDGTVLSEHVYISDISHGLDPKAGLIMQQPLESKGPVTIGRNVFIGYGASVMPGVTLGDHCIVGTRSVVTQSFAAYSMVVGAPARLVKVYRPELGKWVRTSDNAKGT